MTPDLRDFTREVDERGYAVVPDLVCSAEVAALRAALEPAISCYPYNDFQGGRDRGMVHALMLFGEPFERLLVHERLRAHLAALLGSTCVLYAYTSSSMPPGATNYSSRIHVDSPRLIPGYATNIGVTLMLDAFQAANGATEVLPGSHLRPAPPTEADFAAGAARIVGAPGTALIFNARLWHRGGFNRTASWRHAVTINACRSYMKQQFDWPRLVPPAVVERNPPSFRQFLGFDVRVPSSLEEFYVAPERRLYKPGQG